MRIEALAQYTELMGRFVSNDIPQEQFDEQYARLWQLALEGYLNQLSTESEQVSDLLQETQSYSDELQAIVEQSGASAEELSAAAQKVLEELLAMQGEPSQG